MAKSPGRPSKFTPEIRESILARLSTGTTIKATCDSVGIGVSTYMEWVEIGRAHLNGEKHRHMPKTVEERDVFSEFSEATTRAQADGMIRATIALRQGMTPSESVATTTETFEETRLNKKGEPYTYRKTLTKRTVTTMQGDWRAALEYLARRDPENWARTTPQRVEHSGTVHISWQDEAVAMIERGELTQDKAMMVFDNDSDLVDALFARAKTRVSTRQDQS